MKTRTYEWALGSLALVVASGSTRLALSTAIASSPVVAAGTPVSLPVHSLVTGSAFPDTVKLNKIVVDETRRRAYFGGSLARYLNVLDVDTLEIVGTIDSQVDGFIAASSEPVHLARQRAAGPGYSEAARNRATSECWPGFSRPASRFRRPRTDRAGRTPCRSPPPAG